MVYTVFNTASAASDTPRESLLKENIDDSISNLFYTETPLTARLGKVSMPSTEWSQPIDTYSTAASGGLIQRLSSVFAASGTASNLVNLASPEGHTYTAYSEAFQAKMKSIAEIQGRQFSVSGTDRAVATWGMKDRFTYEAMKAAKAVACNFEWSYWWSPGKTSGGADLDTGGGGGAPFYIARQTQGLVHSICASGLQRSIVGLGQATHLDGAGNNFGTTGGALNAGASTWAYNAAGQPLDQDMFKNNLQAQWYALTGKMSGCEGFCGGRLKNYFSSFALSANGLINTRNVDAGSKKVTDTLDLYETDYGPVSMTLSYYLNIPGLSVTVTLTGEPGGTDIAFPYDEVMVLIHPEFWKIGVVRPITMTALAKTGDFEPCLVVGEQGLLTTNPQGGTALVNAVP
jgi:hypothetical protein